MAVPLSTTSVTYLAVAETEPGEGRTTTVLAAGVPAHIGQPTGAETNAAGGGVARVDAVCWSNPVDVDHVDQLLDEGTGSLWEVVAVFQRRGLGQDHTRVQLRRVDGVTL